MLTDVPGVEVGHWTDDVARTGCTVALFPEGTVASGEIRGGAPATREFALLDPSRMINRLDAVMLSGGSAFGLAAGHGAMEWLAEKERGFETAGGVVPIVVGLSLFDLGQGDGSVRPDAVAGRAACDAAAAGPHPVGLVGAGTGATVDKWFGRDRAKPGGIVTATSRRDDLVVSCLIAVNAVGAVDDGTRTDDLPPPPRPEPENDEAEDQFGNTTIGIVATNAIATKLDCLNLARAGHHGYARSLHPSHTAGDGDAIVVAATGQFEVDQAVLKVMVTNVVARAVRSLAD
ncbi:MAG: P1 family peptidase [Actinomycetia bacterium]|nr:P1 family peptidase [Actinomycetes bacterium]